MNKEITDILKYLETLNGAIQIEKNNLRELRTKERELISKIDTLSEVRDNVENILYGFGLRKNPALWTEKIQKQELTEFEQSFKDGVSAELAKEG